MRWLLLLYPWLELLSLIQLGVETTALTALGWVIAMMGLGATMLRRVGTSEYCPVEGGPARAVACNSTFSSMTWRWRWRRYYLLFPGLLSDFFAIVVLIGPLRRGLAAMADDSNAGSNAL